ncbi:MAG: glycerol-3-phosphate acyltransferase [Chloroflexi bacterium]|nr:glycerol-3-phosphate acyltransferase [Chloroflexota bacterium]
MNTVFVSLVCGLVGYIIGSIPFGYLIVKLMKGVDIRSYGSGRTGGTNVFRVAGFPAGLVTALLDIGKGALTVLIVRQFIPGTEGWAEALAGAGVVLGHNASLFIGFRGGAGGATSVGTALALWPLGGVPALVIGLFTLFIIGYASLATILSALAVALVFTYAAVTSAVVPLSYAMFGWAIVGLVVIALRPNISRLVTGNEKRVSVFNRGAERKA